MVLVEGNKTYSLKLQIKTDKFDVDQLMHYCLCIQYGIRDIQLCVIDKRNHNVLILEDYRLDSVKTINSRMESLKSVFDDHSFLRAGFWKEVKISYKTHKFSLVPSDLFYEEVAPEYLSMNAALKPNIEDVYYYKHHVTNAYNIFAGDRRLINWSKSLYPSKKVQVAHQGSSIIQGILKYKDHTHEKMIFCVFDGNIMHVVVSWQLQLLYYNQFVAKQPQDFLKYVVLVFKEFKLSQKTTKMVVWGNMPRESKIIQLFKRYIRNISLGHRPGYQRFGYHFDEIPDHYYFDLLNTYFCD